MEDIVVKNSWDLLKTDYSGPSQLRPPLGPKAVQITETFRFVNHQFVLSFID